MDSCFLYHCLCLQNTGLEYTSFSNVHLNASDQHLWALIFETMKGLSHLSRIILEDLSIRIEGATAKLTKLTEPLTDGYSWLKAESRESWQELLKIAIQHMHLRPLDKNNPRHLEVYFDLSLC